MPFFQGQRLTVLAVLGELLMILEQLLQAFVQILHPLPANSELQFEAWIEVQMMIVAAVAGPLAAQLLVREQSG